MNIDFFKVDINPNSKYFEYSDKITFLSDDKNKRYVKSYYDSEGFPLTFYYKNKKGMLNAINKMKNKNTKFNIIKR